MATFEGYVDGVVGKAVFFWGHYWERPIMFPISQVTIEEDGNAHVMHVRDWLVRKRNLLEFTHYSEEEVEGMNTI